MSADVSESLDNKTKDKSVSNSSENGRPDDESLYLDDDSDEFTDWSEDDDNSQNLDDDLESNFSEKRYSGDGEEQPSGLQDGSQKKVDDDEDRRNPAYVPRKGSFFEHDLRRGSNDRNLDNGVRKVKERSSEHRRRGLWSVDRSQWEHDRFDERSQRPKSVHELVTFYGFNIRKDVRVTNGSKRYGTRNKIRTPLLSGCSSKRSPSLTSRRIGKSKKDSLRTFIIVSNDDKVDDADEIGFESGSQRSDTPSISGRRPLDFDDIKGTNRFIEEPIICFAPKRGEKIDIRPPIIPEVKETRLSSCCDGSEDVKSDSSDTTGYPAGDLIITPSIFQRGGGHAGMSKKKKFTAGSGRIAPVMNTRGKRYPRNNFGSPEDPNYSSDEINSANSVEQNWKGYARPIQDFSFEDPHANYRNPASQYRGKSRSRGKYRATGRARNYFYDGTFPQDIRLIVMCGDNGGDERPEMPPSTGGRKSSLEKPNPVSSQGGFISDILPPVTCCARTRVTRNPADSNPVYSVAKATTITTASVTSTIISSGSDAKTEVATTETIATTQIKEVVKEVNMAEGQEVDSVEDEKLQGWMDKRYSTQRNDARSRNRSSFMPRFPVPPRNRIFHPNAFNNPSSFLPAAFILPTGPLFPPQRHPSHHNMGRNNVPPLLGLNAHNPPSQLLALPVRVTPVPFIFSSSQSLSLPSGQHFPPPLPSPPKLHPSPFNQSASSNTTPSSSSVASSSPSSSSTASSSSSNAVVSRPTSLFQAGPQRNMPHPKHWFRFNPKQCTLLKPFPAFQHHHHHQMQFRQTFSSATNRVAVSTNQSGNKTTTMLSNPGTITTFASDTIVSSSSTSLSSSVASSSSSPISTTMVAASKLSPHAPTFKSSNQAGSSDLVVTSEARDVVPGSATLFEVTPLQSKHWQRSHKACPIEVRGGTVYFSPEVQKFQYKCHPSKKNSNNSVYSFASSEVVYLSSDGKNVEEEKKERAKRILSIVDPKCMDPNESQSNTIISDTTTITEPQELISSDTTTIIEPQELISSEATTNVSTISTASPTLDATSSSLDDATNLVPEMSQQESVEDEDQKE